MSKKTKTKTNCGACVWAVWALTPAGNLRRNIAGQCRCPVPVLPPMPDCLVLTPPNRCGIWISDGTACPTFRPKAGQPEPTTAEVWKHRNLGPVIITDECRAMQATNPDPSSTYVVHDDEMKEVTATLLFRD